MVRFRFSALWVLLVLILLAVTPALAQIQLSNYNPKPGETVYFNYTYCKSFSGVRFLVKEPSGIYLENPSYLSADSTQSGTCAFGYPNIIIKGNITIPSDSAAGTYQLAINSYSWPSEIVESAEFNVNYNTDWKYTTSSPASTWQNLTFNDSVWQTGKAPFADSRQFSAQYFNTIWNSSQIYVRKVIDLKDYTQAALRFIAENNVQCWVNGQLVGSQSNNLYPPGISYCRYSSQGYGVVSQTLYYNPSSYDYKGSMQVDISKYLKPGKNIIACKAWIDSRVFYYGSSYYPGRSYFNVEFLPLNGKEMFWSTNSTQFNYMNYSKPSTYYEYTCSGTANFYNYIFRYDPHFDSSWLWSKTAVTDNSFFFSDPYHYTHHDTSSQDNKLKVGKMPYNGATTYFREWIWSDANVTKTLKISDTKLPTCYLNERQLTLKQYNHVYWKYSTNVNLPAGFNLLACMSTSTTFNQFDYQLAEINGPLKITDVLMNGDLTASSRITFTPVIENASHPEADVSIVMQVNHGNKTEILVNSIKSDNLTNVYSFADAFSYTPEDAGNYSITIAAVDNIDGDNDTYSAEFEIAQAPAQLPIGFLPTAGSSNEKDRSTGSGNLIVVAGTAALGAAALAGAYVYSSNTNPTSRSLKRIEGSLANASSAMSILSAMQSYSQVQNQNTFLSALAVKYNEFKQHLASIAAEQKAIDDEKERLEEKMSQVESQYAAQQLAETEQEPMTWEQWYAQQGVPMPEERKNPVIFPSVGWSELEQQGKTFREQYANQLEQYGLKDLTMTEFANYGLALDNGKSYDFNQNLIDTIISDYQKQKNLAAGVTPDPYYDSKSQKDISDDLWLNKIARGVKYSAEGMWADISNAFTNRVNSILNDPLGTFANDWKSVGAALSTVGNIIADRYYDILTDPIGTMQSDANLVSSAVNNYIEAFKTNPIDTLGKTVIATAGIVGIVAGAVLSPFTAGGSLALTAAGIASLTGVGLIAGNEAYQYATAKTEDELKQKATDDSWDDAMWMVGGAIDGIQAVRFVDLITPTATIKTTSDDIFFASLKAKNSYIEAVERSESPAFVLRGSNPIVTSFKDAGWIKNIDPDGVYYVINKNNLYYLRYPDAINAHELLGETPMMKGAITAPYWVENQPVLGDIAADTAASKIIGKDIFVKTGLPGSKGLGHNWWGLKSRVPYAIDNKNYYLTSRVVNNVQNSIKIQPGFSKSWFNYVTPGQIGYEVINNTLVKK